MFGGLVQLTESDAYEQSSVAYHQFGQRAIDLYGDMYRYGQVGASNITAGKLQVCPAPNTNHHNIAVTTATAAGLLSQKITVTLGATAAAVNEYAGGILAFSDVSPEGETYRIVGHPAANSSASLELKLDRPIVSATTTSSEVTLTHNTWNGVVEAAVEEREPAGVPLIDMTAAYYGWFKTHGDAAVLSGEDYDVGSELTQHASTAGALDEVDTTYGTSMLFYTVGKAKVAGINTEFRTVFLTID